jgi:hypothetical protein
MKKIKIMRNIEHKKISSRVVVRSSTYYNNKRKLCKLTNPTTNESVLLLKSDYDMIGKLMGWIKEENPNLRDCRFCDKED